MPHCLTLNTREKKANPWFWGLGVGKILVCCFSGSCVFVFSSHVEQERSYKKRWCGVLIFILHYFRGGKGPFSPRNYIDQPNFFVFPKWKWLIISIFSQFTPDQIMGKDVRLLRIKKVNTVLVGGYLKGSCKYLMYSITYWEGKIKLLLMAKINRLFWSTTGFFHRKDHWTLQLREELILQLER